MLKSAILKYQMAYLTPLVTEFRAASLKVLSGSMKDWEVFRSELVLLM